MFGDSVSVQADSYNKCDLADHCRTRVVVTATGASGIDRLMRQILRGTAADRQRLVAVGVRETSPALGCEREHGLAFRDPIPGLKAVDSIGLGD